MRKHSEDELAVLVGRTLKTLKEIHEEKERDYTFKCRYIAERVGVSSNLLAYLLRRLPDGLIKVKHRSSSRRICVYKTHFSR